MSDEGLATPQVRLKPRLTLMREPTISAQGSRMDGLLDIFGFFPRNEGAIERHAFQNSTSKIKVKRRLGHVA